MLLMRSLGDLPEIRIIAPIVGVYAFVIGIVLLFSYFTNICPKCGERGGLRSTGELKEKAIIKGVVFVEQVKWQCRNCKAFEWRQNTSGGGPPMIG